MIGIPAYADELLNVRIPRRDIVVGDRPVHAVTQLLGRNELVLAPPLAGTSPYDRFPAYLITADPVERLGLDVRVVAVLDAKKHGFLHIERYFSVIRVNVV